jgi:hypothetical protein
MTSTINTLIGTKTTTCDKVQTTTTQKYGNNKKTKKQKNTRGMNKVRGKEKRSKNKASEDTIKASKKLHNQRKRAIRLAKQGIVETTVAQVEAVKETPPQVLTIINLFNLDSTAASAITVEEAVSALSVLCESAFGTLGEKFTKNFSKTGFSTKARLTTLRERTSPSVYLVKKAFFTTKISLTETVVIDVAEEVIEEEEEEAEIDFPGVAVVEVGMSMNNEIYTRTKNNNSDDSESDEYDWEAEFDEEEPEIIKTGNKPARTKWAVELKSLSRGGAVGGKIGDAPKLVSGGGWGKKVVKVEVVEKVVEEKVEEKVVKKLSKKEKAEKKRKDEKKRKKKRRQALVSKLVEEVVKEEVVKEEEIDIDIEFEELEEESDDEDFLNAFAQSSKVVVKKVVKKVAAKRPVFRPTRPVKKLVSRVYEHTEEEDNALDDISILLKTSQDTINKALNYKPGEQKEEPVLVEEKVVDSFPSLSEALASHPVDKAIDNNRVSTRKKRGRGVDITHMFVQSKTDTQKQKHVEAGKVMVAKKEAATEDNELRTDVFTEMAAMQSEDKRVKAAATKKLKWTRRCKANFNLDGYKEGTWKKANKCRYGNSCGFAHNQQQLEGALRTSVCSFDGGRGNCRKPDTCAFIHTLRATMACECGHGKCTCPRRAENDAEYLTRTGRVLGKYYPRGAKIVKEPRRSRPSRQSRPIRSASVVNKWGSAIGRNNQAVVKSPATIRREREAKMAAAKKLKDAQQASQQSVKIMDKDGFEMVIKNPTKAISGIVKAQGVIRAHLYRCAFYLYEKEELTLARDELVREKRCMELAALHRAESERVETERVAVVEVQPFNWSPPVKAIVVEAAVKKVVVEAATAVMTIQSLLTEFRLNASVMAQLVEMGAESPQDILDMDVDDIKGLGLKNLETKRFGKMYDYIEANC